MGAKRFRFVVAPQDTTPQNIVVADEAGASVSAGGFSVALDPATGAIRSITGVTLKGGANEYLYQAGRAPGDETTRIRRRTSASPSESAGRWSRRSSPNPPRRDDQLRQEVRIIAGLPRVEIVDTIDKRNIYKSRGRLFRVPLRHPGSANTPRVGARLLSARGTAIARVVQNYSPCGTGWMSQTQTTASR